MSPSSSVRPLFLLASFVTAVLVLSAPTAAYACTGTVTVSPSGTGAAPLPPSGPAPGTSLDVVGSDFAAGPVVVHWGSSEGPVLGRAVADRRGDFTLEVVVPEKPGDRPRVVARSTRGGSNGMPSMGWADLATGAPQTAPPAMAAPAPAAGEPASPQALEVAVVAAGLVLAAGTAVLAALAGRRRRRRAAEHRTVGAFVPLPPDEVERELAGIDRSTSRSVGR